MAAKKKYTLEGTLTGAFFHSVGADHETIVWQGQIKDMVCPTIYRVELYDWFMGMYSSTVLVPVEDMKYWKIYWDARDMNEAYKAQERRQNHAQEKVS
jgi:hypothetical protein